MKTYWGSFNQRPLGHEPSALTKRNKRIITFFEGVFFAVRVDSELPLAFLIVSTLPFLLKRQKCETNYYFFRHYLKYQNETFGIGIINDLSNCPFLTVKAEYLNCQPAYSSVSLLLPSFD